MAFERGKYGMEYNARGYDGESSGLGCLVAVIAAVAAVSIGWTVFSRFRERERVVETVAGSVVASIDAQLAAIEQSIRKNFAKDSNG